MTWLTWRQLRVQAAAVSALVAAVAVVVLVTGPRLRELAASGAEVYDSLTPTDQVLFYAGLIAVAAAPAVIGVFWGAPLVARELENGTHRLVWNQSVTRTRWLATRLGLTTLGAAAAVGLLSWAVTWWSEPMDGTISHTRGGLPGLLTPVSFAMRGLVPVGYAVFVVALGATVGTVLRRSLPAMAVTLAIFAFVQVAVPLWVRPHLVTPVTVNLAFSEGSLDSINGSPAGAPESIELHTANRGDWVLSNETVDAPDGPPPCRPGLRSASRGRGVRPGPPGPTRRRHPSGRASSGSPPRATDSGSSTSPRTGSGRCSSPRPACSSSRRDCSPGCVSGGPAHGYPEVGSAAHGRRGPRHRVRPGRGRPASVPAASGRRRSSARSARRAG